MHCGTCGEQGKEGLSLLEPENASLLQFIIKHLQLAGGSFFVCHACVVEIQHWRNFLTRFQTSQTHFQQVLATSDIPQQTTDLSLETILPKCRVLVTKLLQCDSCSFYTNNKSQLESHMQTHLANTSDATRSRVDAAKKDRNRRNLKCAECDSKFGHPEILAWHSSNCHGKNGIVRVVNIGKMQRYECSFCQTTCTTHHSIMWHLQDHRISNLPFECNICKKQFVHTYKLKRHKLRCKIRHTLNTAVSKDHKCYECGAKFVHPEILAWHTEMCHGANTVVSVVKINDRRHKFHCNFCETVHIKHNLIICHFCTEHRMNNLPFHCNICNNKHFLQISHLRNHQLICNNNTSHQTEITSIHSTNGVKCNMCLNIFKSEMEMKKHILNYHAKKIGFKCKYCNQTFSTNLHLFRHYQDSHPDNEPALRCGICNLEFSAYGKKYLDHRNDKHAGRTAFTCKTCSATFSSSNSLWKHVKTKHCNTTFSCQFCSAKFKCKEYWHVQYMFVMYIKLQFFNVFIVNTALVENIV